MDFPIKHGDFPWQNVSSPEGTVTQPFSRRVVDPDKHPVELPGCFASGLGRGQGADGRTGRRLSESFRFSQLGEIHDIPRELPPGKHTKSY